MILVEISSNSLIGIRKGGLIGIETIKPVSVHNGFGQLVLSKDPRCLLWQSESTGAWPEQDCLDHS